MNLIKFMAELAGGLISALLTLAAIGLLFGVMVRACNAVVGL